MSRQANATMIGAFVLFALVLGVGVVAFLGSFNLGDEEEFIIYFDEPVDGLEIGSPVKFRGVSIGRVTKIHIRFNQRGEDEHIPVIVEIDVDLFNSALPIEVDIRDEETFQRFADLGYRAQLESDNLITGLKHIEIDVVKDTEPAEFIQKEAIYKEIPSRPSLPAAVSQTMEEALVRLSALQIQEINDAVLRVLAKLQEGLDEMDFAVLNESIIRGADSAAELMSSERLHGAIDKFSESLTEYRILAAKLNTKVDTILFEASRTNEELQKTLVRLTEAADQFTHVLSSDSSFRHELEAALEEIAEASQALRFFFDYLERNPNSLLTGKKQLEP